MRTISARPPEDNSTDPTLSAANRRLLRSTKGDTPATRSAAASGIDFTLISPETRLASDGGDPARGMRWREDRPVAALQGSERPESGLLRLTGSTRLRRPIAKRQRERSRPSHDPLQSALRRLRPRLRRLVRRQWSDWEARKAEYACPSCGTAQGGEGADGAQPRRRQGSPSRPSRPATPRPAPIPAARWPPGSEAVSGHRGAAA